MFLYQLPAKYSASFEIPKEGARVLEQKLRAADRAKCSGNMDHRVIWNSSCLKILREERGTVLCLMFSPYHESSKVRSRMEQFIDKTEWYYFYVLRRYLGIRCFTSIFYRYESCEPLLRQGLRPVKVRWRQKAEMSKM